MARIGNVDLHTHTTASDGLHAPAENVRMAAALGLGGIAVTDHDTTAGVAEALAEGEKLGITVVPGVEISTGKRGMDIHVLGYFVNIEDTVFLKRLESLRKIRDRRNEMLIERLRELGIPIAMEEVARAAAVNQIADKSIGRPHFAQVLVDRGIVGSVREAFDRYLAKGQPAYVSPPRIQPAEAVSWIREAGGKAVLAHPGIYGDDASVLEIIQEGVDGLEAYHSDHTAEQEAKYLELARRYNLVVTAGSDFHGSRGGDLFHGAIGNRSIDYTVLELLRR